MKYPGDESITLEFKSQLPKNEQIIKTIIGFCNQHGGKLILGVEDDGNIVGIDEEDATKILDQLEHAIFRASSRPIIPKIMSQRIGNKLVIIIEVSEGMNKPYYRHSEGLDNGTYLRIGKNTVRATLAIIEELKWQARGISFENLPVYQASENDLDYEKIKAFLANRRTHANSNITQEVLLSYKLITIEHTKTYPTVAGILLFGKTIQYYFPESMIICSHFKGTQGREAIASIDCNGTLFDQFEQAYDFIVSRLSHAFVINDIKREEKLEIPPVAIREILLNAIVHRNYHLHSPNKIAIYNDRIEIFSPGNFPTPLPDLQLGLTDARNMTICRVFREANLIEKLGSGFITLFDSYQAWKLPKPTVYDGDGFVKCVLPRACYRAESTQTQDDRIMRLFDVAEKISVSDVISAINLPRSTATRKLKEMVQKGILFTIGKGKATRYTKKH